MNAEIHLPDSAEYPEDATARDVWILARRSGFARRSLDPRRVAGWMAETEPNGRGEPEPGLTLFLTNRECPWRCLMCDLWRQTLTASLVAGDVLAQIDSALAEADVVRRQARWLKLYNAGSFFDARAIPAIDRLAVAARTRGFQRVIVENHPSLTDVRMLPFREALGGVRLEVAMGLETAHPQVLERLNKRIDLDGFRRAADFLRAHDCDLRVFVLVKPPFLAEPEAEDWACRSIDFAFECGATVVSLIATRFGNGALEALAARGEFSPPRLETVEAVFRHGVAQRHGRTFLDLWELERSVANPEAVPSRRSDLEFMNLHQRLPWGSTRGL